MLQAGADLRWFLDDEPERVQQFQRRYPQARPARALGEILEDESIQLIVSAAVPDARAPLGIRAMQASKDYLCAKPGVVTLEQLEARAPHAGQHRAALRHLLW